MANLPTNSEVESVTVRRLSVNINAPYHRVIDRFRTLVPQINLSDLRNQTSPSGIAEVVRKTGTTTDFVLFSQFDHGGWIRHFPLVSESSSPSEEAAQIDGAVVHGGRGLQRFIFGNPLFAMTMIREDVEAALHVPLDAAFVEQEDGRSTKMLMMLPGGLVAGHTSASDNEKLKQAASELEGKVLKLIEAIIKI
ncbi:MAG: hypothetical protein Q9227_008741 [Pyrenula ochraceoflavens]